MKDFVKIMFASAVGFVIAGFILMLISIMIFAGIIGSAMSGSGGSKTILQNNSVLHLQLNGSIEERTTDDELLSTLLSDYIDASMGLNDILSGIRKAKNNDLIAGIYINSGNFSASPATLKTIRDELIDFKESGKFVVSYADTYSQGGYYLASVADKVAINPQGMLELRGLGSVPMFFKDALDKLGIEVQVFKVGTYKSAVEPYTMTGMSEANREQITSFLNDIWNNMKADIASSRNITPDNLNLIADEMTMLKESDYLLSSNLVDTLLYESEMKLYLRQLLGVDADASVSSATIADMKTVKPNVIKKSKNRIGLLYATGEITSGNKSEGIQDRYLVSEIEKLRKDDMIKAVVLRVNSPGGSAYASEQIWKAINDLKEEKPVVVSMGDMAASGGYYISCNATKILAEPTTITGSIGIFGIVPSFQGTSKKLGLATDVVKTNKYADFGNLMRPLNDNEKAVMQNYVERGYDLFLTRCAEGRNLPKDVLAEYAEGRVWTGNQAKEIGLVDELGGIRDAIKTAADLAELDEDYLVYEYPRLRSRIEELLDPNKDDLALKTLQEYLGESYQTFMLIKQLREQDFVQARVPFEFVVN